MINIKEAYKIIDKDGNGEKWIAKYIDLGVVEYIVLTAKKVHHSENNPVIRQRYVVREYEIFEKSGKFIKDFETKKEADDYALSLTIKTNKQYDIFKEGIVVSGNNKVSSIEIETKKYKSKPSLKPMANRKIIELHQYVFYGWASY